MRCRSDVIESSFTIEICCKQRFHFSSQSGYMGYQERKTGGGIGEPFRMGSSRMGSNVAQALPRSGLVQLGIMLRSGADEGRSPQVWSYFPGAGGGNKRYHQAVIGRGDRRGERSIGA